MFTIMIVKHLPLYVYNDHLEVPRLLFMGFSPISTFPMYCHGIAVTLRRDDAVL